MHERGRYVLVHAAPLGPVKPVGHTHAEMAVAPVLRVMALAGQAVHDVLPDAVLYEPIGHTDPRATRHTHGRSERALVRQGGRQGLHWTYGCTGR